MAKLLHFANLVLKDLEGPNHVSYDHSGKFSCGCSYEMLLSPAL